MEPQVSVVEVTGPMAAPHRLTYYAWGDPQANETLLCVHGLTRNGRDFDFVARRLANRFYVISPDMPGRGKSDYLADPLQYNYATYLADVNYLLASLNRQKVHWLGTSMGGIIGMMMVNATPGLITQLVLNDVGCLIPAAGLRRIMAYAGVKMQFATMAEAQAALRINCAPFGIKGEAIWQHLFAHSLVQNPDGSVCMAYDPAIMVGFPGTDAITDVNLWATWEGLRTIPTLLMRGGESDILTHETAVQMQSRHLDLTLVEIAKVGHAPALMDDEQVDIIERWLLR